MSAVLEGRIWQRFTLAERLARFSIYFAIVLSIIGLIMIGEVLQLWVKKVFKQ